MSHNKVFSDIYHTYNVHGKYDQIPVQLKVALDAMLIEFDASGSDRSAVTLVPIFASYHALVARCKREEQDRTNAYYEWYDSIS